MFVSVVANLYLIWRQNILSPPVYCTVESIGLDIYLHGVRDV